MRIGVLAPAEIALRRFMPALADIPKLEFAGVAVHTPTERFGTDLPKAEVIAQTLTVEQQRAEQFVTEYGGHIYPSYQSMIDDSSIEAIYLPLPPVYMSIGVAKYWMPVSIC